MAYKQWTPRVVGGTDIDGHGTSTVVIFDDDTDVIETSHQELADYTKSFEHVPIGAKGYIDINEVTWSYGSIQRRNGTRGQYVTESHFGKQHQIYWVDC